MLGASPPSQKVEMRSGHPGWKLKGSDFFEKRRNRRYGYCDEAGFRRDDLHEEIRFSIEMALAELESARFAASEMRRLPIRLRICSPASDLHFISTICSNLMGTTAS